MKELLTMVPDFKDFERYTSFNQNGTGFHWLFSTEGVLITKAEAALIVLCGTKARLL